MEKVKKLFGGINLSWKKLIIFAISIAVYTAIMAILPIAKDTSFSDIAATLEWWILFGVIAIFTIGYVLISNGILFDIYKKYEVYEDLEEYGITLSDEYYISGFFSTEQGSAELIEKDGKYVLRLTGIKNTIYKFGISAEDDKQLRFEYHFDDNGKLVLEKANGFN